jgi:hypothetical protein
MAQNFIENDLVILPKNTLEILLQCSPDEIYLFLFFYHTLKWEKSKAQTLSINNISKYLSWDKKKVETTRKNLIDKNIIKVVGSTLFISFYNNNIYNNNVTTTGVEETRENIKLTTTSECKDYKPSQPSTSRELAVEKKERKNLECSPPLVSIENNGKEVDIIIEPSGMENSAITTTSECKDYRPSQPSTSRELTVEKKEQKNPECPSTLVLIENKGKKVNTIVETSKVENSVVTTGSGKLTTGKKVWSPETIEYILTETLFNHILERQPNYFGAGINTPSAKEEKIQKWCVDMDYTLRIDKRDPEQVLDVIEWSQGDTFWQKNICSTYKLRTQFGKLLDLMNVFQPVKPTTNDPNKELTLKLIGNFEDTFLNCTRTVWPEREERKFVDASKRIINFSRMTKLKTESIQVYLIKCIKKKYTDSGMTVYPGSLCSDVTWNVLMPQYLTEIGISY